MTRLAKLQHALPNTNALPHNMKTETWRWNTGWRTGNAISINWKSRGLTKSSDKSAPSSSSRSYPTAMPTSHQQLQCALQTSSSHCQQFQSTMFHPAVSGRWTTIQVHNGQPSRLSYEKRWSFMPKPTKLVWQETIATTLLILILNSHH